MGNKLSEPLQEQHGERRRARVGRRHTEQVIERLVRLGIALSSERDSNRLLEMILIEAKEICQSDGGTLYLVDENERALHFAITRNDSLGISDGGVSGHAPSLPPVPLYDGGEKNFHNVAAAVFHTKKASNIEDAYRCPDYDFRGTRVFDARTGYRSQSFLTLPLINSEDSVIGVLQLINAQDRRGNIIPFDGELEPLVEALASQAAVSLENRQLIDAQRKLWDALIKMIAAFIDDKSPYTGGHCQRVPMLTEMLTRAACEADHSIFADFDMSKEEWYELHVAAWLHDCGKIATPEYVIDKATKLETIYNRIHEIRTRFEVVLRDCEIDYLRKCLDGMDEAEARAAFDEEAQQLQDDFAFVAAANIGGEFMNEDDIERLKQIGERTWIRHFDRTLGMSPAENDHLINHPPETPPAVEPLLGDTPLHQLGGYNLGEVYNLSIKKGTLTREEREVINDHINLTIRMLEQLPFPKNLRRVPEYAGGHHEKMDGTGYPRGLTRDQMSIPARVMAIADIFEALTAADRPYKKAKTLSEALEIMARMARNNHIDADLFDLFLRSGVWKDYADRVLTPQQMDAVDIEAYLPPRDLLETAQP